jgi:hypothetical protein
MISLSGLTIAPVQPLVIAEAFRGGSEIGPTVRPHRFTRVERAKLADDEQLIDVEGT